MKNKNHIITIIIIMLIVTLIVILFYVANTVFSPKKESGTSNDLITGGESNSLNELANTNDFDASTNNDDNKLNYVHTKTANVLLNRMPYYAEVSIDNGSVAVKEKGNGAARKRIFSIKGEKIKYLHYDYYQSSDTNVIFYLTESGNLYVNEFTCDNELTLDIINNFKKLDYSNVKELVKQKNENYLKEDEAGMADYKEFYIYALVGDKLVKVSNQYRI